MNKQIRVIELFGGIGAPAAALRRLGIDYRSIDYVEIDEKAVRSYNEMFKDELKHKPMDVRDYRFECDLMVHGSPCQDFSIAGHQKGADEGSETRSSLMWETLRIIRNMGENKPKIVVWENVKNVLSKHMRHNFERYLKEMESMGYENSYGTLIATDFGLPQQRERVFTVSILGGGKVDFDTLERHPMDKIDGYLEKLEEPGKYKLCPSMHQAIGKKKEDSKFQGYLNVVKDFVYTITTAQDRIPNSGVVLCPNGEYRMLTERETFRFQGFTDTEFDAAQRVNPGRKGYRNAVLYKQAGNAMPVPVLMSLFSAPAIRKALV